MGGGAPWEGAARRLGLLPAVLRLCGPCIGGVWLPPVAMAVGVSVGYVRWVGVWARAWEGRAAREAEWDGMEWKERGAEWADGRLEWGRGVVMGDGRWARASGFEGPGFGGLDSTRNPCTTKRAVPRPSGASLGLSSGAALPRASLCSLGRSACYLSS